jgi:hypothetical protein
LGYVRALQPGDQVKALRGIYAHHAIYVGNGWLIEFGGGLGGGPVSWVRWDVFQNGDQVVLVRAGGDLAVNRAVSQLGRNDFNLVSSNCEHFANWCTTGDWASSQVWAAGTVAVLVALMIVSSA